MTAMTIPDVTISIADPRGADARALVAELDVYLGGLYDPEDNFLTPVEDLTGPQARFWLARAGDRAIGCGALRLFADYGEVKRMYVRPEGRGMGIGRSLLAAIEAEARGHGLPALKLETGPAQVEAVRLYERAGFRPCCRFGDYPSCGGSLFMSKDLTAVA